MEMIHHLTAKPPNQERTGAPSSTQHREPLNPPGSLQQTRSLKKESHQRKRVRHAAAEVFTASRLSLRVQNPFSLQPPEEAPVGWHLTPETLVLCRLMD